MKINLFAINLKKYSTLEEFEKLGSDNNINLDGSKLLQYKSRFSKIFIDLKTLNIVAVQFGDGTMQLSSEGENMLSGVEVLSLNTNSMEDDINIDDILDKINENGIDSLNTKEKYILKKYSKK